MNTFATYCRFHVVGFCVSAVAALFVAAPLIAFPSYAGEAYRGINIAHFSNDEHYYLTRMKDALEGHPLGQPFLREGKVLQDSTFSYVERALALPLRLFGAGRMDVVVFYNVLNTAGVMLLTFLLYLLSHRLSDNRWLAAASALFVVCGYTIIEAKTLFFPTPDIYGRSLFPYAGTIPFFGFLIAMHSAIVMKKIRSLIYAALMCGVLFYVYFFSWTFAGAFLASLALIYALQRKWQEVKHVLYVGAAALALGSWNLYSLLQYFSSEAGAQVSHFQTAFRTHMFVMSKIGLGTLALAAAAFFYRERDENEPFVWALMLAGWVALNQQVLSGRLVQYGHYYWYFIVPLSIIIGTYFLARFLPARGQTTAAILLISLGVLNVAGQQYRSFHAIAADKIREQSYAPILSALDRLPYGVIFANADGSSERFLPTIFTPHDLYWIPAAELHAFDPEQLREAIMLYAFMDRRSRKDPAAYLRQVLAEPGSVSTDQIGYLYTEYESLLSGRDYKSYQRALAQGERSFGGLRDDLLSGIAADYKKRFAKPADVKAHMRAKGVSYVLWDTVRSASWDLEPLAVREIARSDGLILYSVEN